MVGVHVSNDALLGGGIFCCLVCHFGAGLAGASELADEYGRYCLESRYSVADFDDVVETKLGLGLFLE